MGIESDTGHKETEDLLGDLERKIKKEYRRANKETQAKLDKYLSDFERKEKEKLKLVKKGEMTVSDYNEWRLGQELIGQRWQEMVNTLAEDYVNADKIARSMTDGYMPEVYALNHNYATFQVEQGSLVNTSYTLYDKATVERLIRDNPDLLPKPSEKTEERIRDGKVKRWNKQKITAEVTQGILQGESVQKISKRLRNVTDMDARASIRNARTMFTGAQNAGRVDAYKRASDMGIKVKQEWLAVPDNRTRHAHRVLDGQRVEVGEPFAVDGYKIKYPGDKDAPPYLVYNCRCTLAPVLQGFEHSLSELGLIYSDKLGEMSYDEWKNGRKIISKKDYSEDLKLLKRDIEESNIKHLKVEKLQEQLSEVEIIDKISGGDMTDGSCASLSFCYIGNKNGLDIRDFRGGDSQEVFSMSSNIKRMFEIGNANYEVYMTKYPAKETADIVKNIAMNKEYMLTAGKHSAIIRKTEEGLQYLELQSELKSGWKFFESDEKTVSDTLIKRFGVRKTEDSIRRSDGTKLVFEKEVMLAEVDSFQITDDFIDMLGYINTSEGKQKKGAKGGIR